MRKQVYFGSLCVVVCLGLLAPCVCAQNEISGHDSTPAAKAYKMKKVDASDLHSYPRILSWAALDATNSIVFANDSYEDETSDTDTLVSFTLSSKGKAGPTNKLLELKNGRIAAAAAFWNAFLSPAQGGSGVLFVAFTPEGVNQIVNFAMARFDENGELIGDLDVFLELDLPAGDTYYSNMWVKATQRDGVIGVVIGAEVREWSPSFSGGRGSEFYFAEFGVDGTLLSTQIPAIKLPTVGDASLFQPFAPAWNGESWMVPVVMTVLEEKTYQGNVYTDEVGYRLMMLRVTPKAPGGPFKTKVKKVAKDKINIHWPTFISPVFLPVVPSSGPPDPAESETLNLLYIRAAPAGSAGRGINAKKYSYFLQPINAKGRKSGKAFKVDMPKWNRQFEGTPGLSSEETYSNFSNAYVRPDNRIALVHSRSADFYKASDSSVRTELQMDYYAIDPIDGTTGLMAHSTFTNQFAMREPVLGSFGSKMRSLIISRQEIGGKQMSYFYFGILPN